MGAIHTTSMRLRIAIVTAAFSAAFAGTTAATASPRAVYWNGPYPTKAACEEIWRGWLDTGAAVGTCRYRDLVSTWQDGWYFPHSDVP